MQKYENKKEVFIMNTKSLEKFEVLNSEMLASVEGGKIGAGEAAQALAVCTVAGGTIGSVFPGVGTAVGAILGAQYCTGAWAIIRAH
ncbi:hypothetical protein SAIN_0544 [Streptococcus anginosus C1051]|nr:hypothetical protein SAIN_0544 [Streptococcus anginosus C1051]